MTKTSLTDPERADYELLLAGSAQRSVFAEPWWLDAVTGSPQRWRPNVLRAEDGSARAAWPLAVRVTSVGAVATGVPYSPFLGPLLPGRPGELSTSDSISREVELLEALAEQLQASHVHVEAACMPELDYWTPLHWHGFEQTTRTTWRIDATVVPAALRPGMRKKSRGALTAAERDGLVITTGTVADLLTACAATFDRQDDTGGIPGRAVLERVATAALGRERGEILAVHKAGELVSAGLVVWDDRFSYNLANGRLDVDGAVGAPTLLLHESTVRALERGTGFDFEGSMLKPVERFVRGFGGTPHAYSVVRWSAPAWSRVVARKRRLKRLLRR